MNSLTKESLLTLYYFSFFDHPLSASEVHKLSRKKASYYKVESALAELLQLGLVEKEGRFYSLQGRKACIEKRIFHKRRNDFLLKKAALIGNTIYSLPFVSAVGVSGSLSKDSATPNPDIDFFIITKPSKVYLVKSMLKFYKKFWLKNDHKYLCNNYIISEKKLTIDENNIFQATELATLIPLYGQRTFQKFYAENTWLKAYFPNHESPAMAEDVSKTLKSAMESVAALFPLKYLNLWLMKRFEVFADKKYKNKSRGVKFTFHPEESKYFPVDSQNPVLAYYEKFPAFHEKLMAAQI